MSNAVKGLSALLAQCVTLRSSNQTLTGSNLAAYPYSFFFWLSVFRIGLLIRLLQVRISPHIRIQESI